ncbi:unnamed protein product [Effrenium voratum]|uniref:Uncharacterized protein n=1 Tax=Effrenium voratum TaxID=2562239 RepID=A0AA36JPC3_9DINO|nr:unnamed protein product [Effrenium voratum]
MTAHGLNYKNGSGYAKQVQSHAQLPRGEGTVREEQRRLERLNQSLWEQRRRLEGEATDLRGKLARAEAQSQREVQELRARLGSCEAAKARQRSELERELALHRAGAEQQRRLRQEQEKEIHDLRQELSQARAVQGRVREQEDELLKLRHDIALREEERRVKDARFNLRNSGAVALSEWRGADESRIEGASDISTASAGAQEAVNKMRLLQEQLRSLEGAGGDQRPIFSEPGLARERRDLEDAFEAPAHLREAQLLAELQQEHLMTIRLHRAARAAIAGSMEASVLSTRRDASREASREAPEQQLRQRPQPLRPETLASPSGTSAGAVLGSDVRSSDARGSPLEAPEEDTRAEARVSPSSCQVLSPALSLEALQSTEAENAAGAMQDSPRSRPLASESHSAGRLPPAQSTQRPEGGIGIIAPLSPSPRQEVEVEKGHEESEMQTRLRELELDRSSWRRRTLLLEEQMQKLQREALAPSTQQARWRPQQLDSEVVSPDNLAAVSCLSVQESSEEVWKKERQQLEVQLAQVCAERDRMMEAANELRADLRRKAPASPMPSASEVMRQALQLASPSAGAEDRFGVTPSPREAPKGGAALVLPIPRAGTCWSESGGSGTVTTPREQEVAPRPPVAGSPVPASWHRFEAKAGVPPWPRASPCSSPCLEVPAARPEPPPLRPCSASLSPPPPPPLEDPHSPSALRVRDALRHLSPRRALSTSPRMQHG